MIIDHPSDYIADSNGSRKAVVDPLSSETGGCSPGVYHRVAYRPDRDQPSVCSS